MERKTIGIVDGVFVEIYERPVKDEDATEREGTPIFRNQTYIRKKVPNQRDIYDQPVKSTDRQRYQELFRKHEAGEASSIEGTPLEEWPQLDASQVATLKAAGVFTVQQLSNMPETGGGLPNAYRQLKFKAAQWLQGEGSEVRRLRDEVDAREKHIAEQDKKIADLVSRLDALEGDKPRRGRPPKDKEAA
ncbi:MAG: hypothetical protein OEV41_05740 [Gammaproteobacteria bacterium]|nr:hypothetical protein [Gammaproteobacteria bacterium]